MGIAKNYEEMSDEELRQILRQDADCPETGDVLPVMSELAKRSEVRGEAPDVKAAWQNFRRYYLADQIVEAPRSVNWKRRLVALTAAAVLLVGGAIAVVADDSSVHPVLVKWTNDTFSLVMDEQPKREGELSKPPKKEYGSLQEALTDYGITTKLAPTWLPEGYELHEVRAYVLAGSRGFSAVYFKGDNLLRVEIRDYLADAPFLVQQSSKDADVYTRAGVAYYIFPNLERLNAVWLNNGFECVIAGSVTAKEMRSIIDSISKGE